MAKAGKKRAAKRAAPRREAPEQITPDLEGPPDTLALNALESHLWEAANILRGSPLDRADWKSYILPLLFFKRICDVWDEETAAVRALYGTSDAEDFPEAHRFQVPEGCHWQDVRGKAANVGTALQSALRGIEKANDKHLYGVFGDAQWTNRDRLPDSLLKDLVEHFSSIALHSAAVTTDILGDAYEVLIKRFADATTKKAGEFYTPRSVVRLMAAILGPKPGETVYDPACGTGGMLLAAVADLATIEKQGFSLSIPLYVARSPAGGTVAAGEGSEPESLAAAWAKWKADGEAFWRQMEEVTAMLDGLAEGDTESTTQNQRPKRGLPREH